MNKGITFVCPIRGREEMRKHYEYNISKNYGDFNYEIIYVVQDDDKPFMPGQLRNIGCNYAKYDYIAIRDVDVVDIEKINPIEAYEQLGPCRLTDYREQVSIDENENIVLLDTKIPCGGYSYYAVFSKKDWIKYNGGFTNLCIAWGYEDNVMGHVYNMKTYHGSHGHIKHPLNENTYPLDTVINKQILDLYTRNKIDPQKDGFNQMVYDVVSDNNISDNIREIRVKNIGVRENFEYKDLFLKHHDALIREKDNIIVSLTTWEKRIGNIPVVLDSILKNTVLPYRIMINLAVPNFPLKENSLPIEVREFLNKHSDIIEVNWLKNDTTVWKKSIPALYKYPNDAIICIDDDFIYPADFIETFKKKHKECPNTPISGVQSIIFEGNIQHCGPASLDKLEYMKDYLDYFDKQIFDIGDEDTFYTWIYSNTGKMIYVGKTFHTNMKSFNSVGSYSANNRNKLSGSWSKIKSIGKSKEKTNIVEYICCPADSECNIIEEKVKEVKPAAKSKPVIKQSNLQSILQKKTKKSKLEQLKEDIKKGKVIIVNNGTGWVWKRVDDIN